MKKLVITTAKQFNAVEKESFEKRIFKIFGESTFEYHVDEAIIGGVVIFDGEKLYDGSIKNRIQRVSEMLKKD